MYMLGFAATLPPLNAMTTVVERMIVKQEEAELSFKYVDPGFVTWSVREAVQWATPGPHTNCTMQSCLFRSPSQGQAGVSPHQFQGVYSQSCHRDQPKPSEQDQDDNPLPPPLLPPLACPLSYLTDLGQSTVSVGPD